MYLGKAIRLGRMFNGGSGRLLAITLDHAIARGVLPGLVDVESAVALVAAGRPDAITLRKGIASRLFSSVYAADGISLYPALRELFSDLRDRVQDRATESGGGLDTMMEPTSEIGGAHVTWSVGACGPGKQA